MTLPTISEISTAARQSAQTRPRLGASFFREAIRALVDANDFKSNRATVEALNLPGDAGYAQTIIDHVNHPLRTEADLRVVFVTLAILSDPDEQDARMRWANALNLRDEEGGPW